MRTIQNEAAERATILALSLGDDELTGIAFVIALRSPSIQAGSLRRAAEQQARQDTFGRLGRRAAKTKRRERITFDDHRHEQTDDRPSRAERIGDRIAFADRCAEQLGELAEPLADGWRIDEAAELCDISRASAFRRLRVVRERLGEKFEQLARIA